MDARLSNQTETTQNDLVTEVVEALAEANGEDPLALSPRLYDVVDLEAIETLFADERRATVSNLRVQFEYCGQTVTIADDGTVTVADGDESVPQTAGTTEEEPA